MSENKEKVICPDDGSVCTMKSDDKHGEGCWLCPKIQNLRKTPYDKERKENDKGGSTETSE